MAASKALKEGGAVNPVQGIGCPLQNLLDSQRTQQRRPADLLENLPDDRHAQFAGIAPQVKLRPSIRRTLFFSPSPLCGRGGRGVRGQSRGVRVSLMPQ